MPLFTVENAAELGRKGAIRRKELIEQRKAEAKQAEFERATPEPEAAIERTKRQLSKVDDMIDAALEEDDADLFLRLSAAKERLWKLVSPTAGVLKQPRGRQDRLRPAIAPMSEQQPATPQAETSISANAS
jgi:hypothetical protein